MSVYEGQPKGPNNAKRRAKVVLYVVTIAHALLLAFLILGGTIMVSALTKLIWRAMQFGWNLWA